LSLLLLHDAPLNRGGVAVRRCTIKTLLLGGNTAIGPKAGNALLSALVNDVTTEVKQALRVSVVAQLSASVGALRLLLDLILQYSSRSSARYFYDVVALQVVLMQPYSAVIVLLQ
jgi:hypothetical protein